MQPLVAYPFKWRDYSSLEIKPNDLVGNLINANKFMFKYTQYQLSLDTRHLEWPISMSPLGATPFYMPETNKVVIPLAILQPPFFTNDNTNNHAKVGFLIAHEIGHAFHSTKWLTDKDDIKKFNEIFRKLERQYNDDYNINGTLTLHENFADRVGLEMAFQAFKDNEAQSGEEKTTGDTPSRYKQFYEDWAKPLQSDRVYDYAKDIYPPSRIRTNVNLQNQPEFYTTFKVKKGNGMYLPEDKRIHIW